MSEKLVWVLRLLSAKRPLKANTSSTTLMLPLLYHRGVVSHRSTNQYSETDIVICYCLLVRIIHTRAAEKKI